MRADCAWGKRQGFGNLAHRATLREREEDVEFPRRQNIDRALTADGALHDHLLGDRGLDERLAVRHLAYRADQLFRRAALGEVTESAGVQHARRVNRVLMRG